MTHRLAFAAGFLAALGACSLPSMSSRSTGETVAGQGGDLLPGRGRGVLVVGRERGGPAAGCAHAVSLDGTPGADLRPGGWVTFYPLPGRHVVSVRASGAGCTGESTLAITLGSSDEQALRTRIGAGGELTIAAVAR